MKNRLIILGILSAGVLFIENGHSQSPNVETNKEVDLKAGEEIAMKGNERGAVSCMACHGSGTNENLTGAFPRIAGQSAMYLSRQLEDYASGVRKNAVMEPIAKALSGEERDNVSGYYSSLKMQKWKPSKKPVTSVLKRGELLAKTGDQKIMVQACNNCHGPGGVGMAPAIPYLAGQFGDYIKAQLNLWKSGQRANSEGQMLEISKRLSDKDIAALAAYFEQVQTAK